jgi:hypothetical protein
MNAKQATAGVKVLVGRALGKSNASDWVPRVCNLEHSPASPWGTLETEVIGTKM